MLRSWITLVALASSLAAQGPRKGRTASLVALRDDLSAALPNSTLDAKHKKNLQKNVDNLSQAVEARRNREKVDPRKVHSTLEGVRKAVARSEAFRAEDREKVLEDLRLAHEAWPRKAGRRQRVPRPMPRREGVWTHG